MRCGGKAIVPGAALFPALLLLLTACAPTSGLQGSETRAAGSGAGADTALPDDVAVFRARRERCDHFRGEEPADAARAAFVARELDRFCRGTDASLARLRARHADAPAVMAVLSVYDDGVE